ncbi:hypothetical protein [Streptomyces tsukubensis]|uniref:Lipoprotein n=1 Tax=Streptomyces tsukubensis TaxID=83656 RepID=A0A1V4AFM0_9ACTN|nr:hypothetical protein [Streptomyces tsukubensis]OON82816.1 hypothetical protein B1H18_01910 [Streptomyces tsukubensis]QFR92008.1 hypothetical protein GBW32_01775 [Streptomyces tsukubensis]
MLSVNRGILLGAAVCAVAVMGLTGCSESGKPSKEPFQGQSADRIADRAVAATKDASSVRLAGRLRSGSKPVSVDIAVDTDGKCDGTMTTEGAKIDLVRTGTATYVKGDEKFWRSSMESGRAGAETDKVLDELRGKWVKMPAGDTGVSGICDKDSVVSGLDGNKAERTGLTKRDGGKVDGEDSVALTKKKSGGATATVYVATEGKPYILKVVQRGGDEPGTLSLSDYGTPVDAKAPPAGQVVDLGRLAGGT